ncbi:MAG: glycosyltransferase family 4 protein [Candidatus Stygibacter australis]|nr:glycosyltransferase family 4 protein [Candidatus Stygibacter australis]MDP8322734.1 glycosyltransferase family 4 protein [Candidatus Stygibacter australis]
MNKIKILWINSRADFTGGCESYIYHTARQLSKTGYSNTLIYDVDGWTEPVFTNAFDAAFPRVVLSRQVKEIDPDIIYVHRLEGKEAIKDLISTGKPVVRFFHDHKLFCLREHKYKTISHRTCTKPSGIRCYPCLGFIGRGRGIFPVKISSLNKLRAEQNINKKLNGFVVASEYMKSHLIDHGFSTSKILVNPLYSWKHTENYDPADDNYLLFTGQLVRGKGIDILLKAMTLLEHDISLMIAGSGRQAEKFKKLAFKLGLEKKVTFLGFVEQQKLKNLYSNCTCVIMPSRVPETFGLSGLEAMSWSKPVIASNVGGISQWLTDGVNGYLVPSNQANKLAAKIDKLLSDRQKAARMGETGNEIYKEKFTAAEHLGSLQTYFKEFVKGSKL